VRSGKEPILKARGYVYNFDRMAYFNRGDKKAFSVEWLEDHTDEDLQKALGEPINGWKVYLNSEPSQSVIDIFLAEVNG
jgi:hypothetical protein